MTNVPEKCQVLVIGGGPAGSYSASALAREGIDVVLLEAEKFPRYHIGESMLPSMRHFLKFIDAYDKWDAHGFNVKNGGAFRLNWSRPETYTDFISAGGPGGYAWNVIRSEADELLFKHAAECGVKTFDDTKVASIEFAPSEDVNPLGRPVSATWTRKDGTSGTLAMDYIVDASGRNGLISTKYLKNRTFNKGLRNVASWGYWKGGGVHGVGTHKEGAPYFEALKDASGWVWFIPLHNGTHSVGVVQNQEMATEKKRKMAEPSSKGFYLESLEFVPGIKELLSNAELISEVKSASDWSYSASSYAFPGVRIAGDAGSFIDPFFSSGVHLALSGGLSAATTIAAAIRGDCDETVAASWHDKKTSESYTRFLLVVSSALKQIRSQDEPVISDFDEQSFERAFDLFRPIIQGQADADAKGKLTQAEMSKTVEFCFRAFAHVSFEEKEALVQKLKSLGHDADANDEANRKALDELEKHLTPEEQTILKTLKGRRMVRPEDSLNIDNFTLDSIDGLAPRLEKGNLGLSPAKKAEVKYTTHDALSFLNGEARAAKTLSNGHSQSNGNHMCKDHDQTNGHTETNGHIESNGNAETNGHTEANAQSQTNGHTNGHAQTNGNHLSNGHDELNGHNNVEVRTVKSCMADLIAAEKSSFQTPVEEATRHRLISSLHQSAEDLETPFDTVVRLVDAGRQTAMVCIGGDLGIFKSLVESKRPLSSEELAKATMADPLLVSRIMRYMVASRLVGETGPNQYVASKKTYVFADPRIEHPIRFFHAFSNPAFHALPEFLKETGYQNEPKGSAFQKALSTDLEPYPWLKQHPDVLKNFQAAMRLTRDANGVDMMPLDESVSSGHDGAMFVDIGGNTGHQAAEVLSKYPELAGRVIVQDRGEVIKCAPDIKGIQWMEHDFFQTQPVKGAKYYYLRAILHNWDDKNTVQILSNIVPAMSAGSLVAIDEVVVPEENAHVWPAGLDLQMYSLFSTTERTASQWDAILDKAGLRAVAVKKYAPVMQSSVIFAAAK
ncbi:O-methyltransferase [Aspergillus parasiticus SU-1]|uniref:O-methyltransferase n=1 Tax=Aspergillus parasiticus (strain ATCC 56775 / NRRL 5862 / SRRC 143 / SU-1) TaxID=1403190 RepID=A0A0F0I8Q3_ASPPU|nr:O-methyltransferase [Aspergillus parasiticus SU-1]